MAIPPRHRSATPAAGTAGAAAGTTYHDTGLGARIPVPADRPQLTDEEAVVHPPQAYLGDWTSPE